LARGLAHPHIVTFFGSQVYGLFLKAKCQTSNAMLWSAGVLVCAPCTLL
jgi:hypothetical protein